MTYHHLKINGFYNKEKLSFYILIILLSALILSIAILCCVPPVSRDALIYHLALPKLYLKHGGIYEIPSLVFSYFPMNLSLLYMIPLRFGNDILPKFIHFSFALLTAWLIFVYLKKRISSLYALLGVVFFLSIPLIAKLSIIAYVDLGLAFFSTAALFYLLKWIETKFRLKFLLISGLCCGLALGTKYNGLMVLFFLTLFVPFVYVSRNSRRYPECKNERSEIFANTPSEKISKMRQFHFRTPELSNQYKAAGYGLVFMFTALLIFSPWMIRNYLWTNNPLYPLYDNWFNPGNPAPPYSILTIMNFEMRSVILKEPWWQIALLPLRIFFQGQDGNPQYFDGKLNPFLLLAIFTCCRFRKKTPIFRCEMQILLAFSSLILLFVLFTTNMCQMRYLVMIIPAMVILSVFGLHEISAFCKERFGGVQGNLIVLIIVSAMLYMNAVYIAEQFRYVDPISYISGRISRDAYIAKYRGEHPAMLFANRHLPENAKILGFFTGERRYYSEREIFFDTEVFRKSLLSADAPEAIVRDLRNAGVTHLLIRYDLFTEWCDNNFEGRSKNILDLFIKKHLISLFSERGYGLFELKPFFCHE